MKITRSIVLEEETWDRISEIAEREFTSNAAIIRKAISEKLEQEKENQNG